MRAKIKKVLGILLSLQLCFGALLFSSCAETQVPPDTDGENSSGGLPQNDFISIVDIAKSTEKNPTIYLHRYACYPGDSRKYNYGTYINENVSATNTMTGWTSERKATVRFTIDTNDINIGTTPNGMQPTSLLQTTMKVKWSITEQELSEYMREGFRYLTVPVLVTAPLTMSSVIYYPIFSVDKDTGERYESNTAKFNVYVNEWIDLQWPITWLYYDFQRIEDSHLIFFSYNGILNQSNTVYDIYIGDIGLKK